MIKQAIRKVVKRIDLHEEEMKHVMEEMITGKATSAQIGSFVTAMRMKGETVDEITGAVKALQEKRPPLSPSCSTVSLNRDEINLDEETILDTCGTGGDGTQTFNISTATAFVVAGGGVKVAKHGYRAVSSRCGSADVLESLNLNLQISAAAAERCLEEIGITFLYAPCFHDAIEHLTAHRRDMGIRTIFNLMGPLTNPMGVTAQILGVYDPTLTEPLATVLGRLGIREAFVFCGENTYDEISICGPTTLSHLKGETVTTAEICPEDFGLNRASPETLRGGNARQNAHIIQKILGGEKGPRRDAVVLNAAAAFVAAGEASDFKEGIERAHMAIDSGKAQQKLYDLIQFTNSCGSFTRDNPWGQ